MNRSAARGWPLVAASLVFLVALNLRPALTSVGPLLPDIASAFALDEARQGVLGALPLIAFAAVSPLVPGIASRLGAERTILAALGLLAAGVVIRSTLGAGGLWAGTAVVGGAIAIGNVLVPVIVKRDFPRRMSLATGVYSACITLGASIASAVAVPLAGPWTWRGSLAFWALPPLVAALLWALRLRVPAPEPDLPLAPGDAPVSVWRQPTAWLVTAFMALQSTAYYIMITWLPTIEAAQGVSPERAGVHLFVYQLVGVAAGLAIPRLLRRPEGQVAATVTVSAPILIGALGLALAPDGGLAWIIMIGLGTGSSLVVALALIGIRGRTPDETMSLSGMAQSIGYLLAAVGPVLFGAIGQATGSWRPSLFALAAIAALQLAVAVPAGRVRR
ncbi:CynX/NimT family MFS transporter [Microbacterium sp. gxy059]|uniref:CynX/NimT family MFS transporter n=1 Tax=Microbacterium sp. gxy059 TaxID=2957199 RepID=UPI003D98F426